MAALGWWPGNQGPRHQLLEASQIHLLGGRKLRPGQVLQDPRSAQPWPRGPGLSRLGKAGLTALNFLL